MTSAAAKISIPGTFTRQTSLTYNEIYSLFAAIRCESMPTPFGWKRKEFYMDMDARAGWMPPGWEMHWSDIDAEALLRRYGQGERNFREINLSGAKLWRMDLSGADLSGADLVGADLSEANLSEANLSGANLTGANLRRANLIDTKLMLASLRGANLEQAELTHAILEQADLSWANLTAANLSAANLNRAVLVDANLTAAILRGATLKHAKLKGKLDPGQVELGWTILPDGTVYQRS
jgi:hypothetical protein